MFMMIKPRNNKYIKTQQDYLFVVLLKAIMPRYLLMVKLEQEKHTLWKDLDTICMMIKEVLFLEQFKIYLDIFSLVKIKM